MKNVREKILFIVCGLLSLLIYNEVSKILGNLTMDISQSMLLVNFELLPYTKLISIIFLTPIFAFFLTKLSIISDKRNLKPVLFVLFLSTIISKIIGFFSGKFFNVVGYIYPTYIDPINIEYWNQEYQDSWTKFITNENIVETIEFTILLIVFVILLRNSLKNNL